MSDDPVFGQPKGILALVDPTTGAKIAVKHTVVNVVVYFRNDTNRRVHLYKVDPGRIGYENKVVEMEVLDVGQMSLQ